MRIGLFLDDGTTLEDRDIVSESLAERLQVGDFSKVVIHTLALRR